MTDRAQPHQLGHSLTGHTDTVFSMSFAPDGRTLATGSQDATVILWDLSDRAQPRQLGQPLTGHTGDVHSVAFAPDAHTLATAASTAPRSWTSPTLPSPPPRPALCGT